MIRVPAVVLGTFAILVASFFVGYRGTYYFVSFIKSKWKTIGKEFDDNFTLGIAITIGILSAIFSFFIFSTYAQSHSGEVLVFLIFLGFIVSALSFLIPALTTNQRQTVTSNKWKTTTVNDTYFEAQRNKVQRKREYYFKRYNVTLKGYELLLSIMLGGWINFISRYASIRKLFSEIYFANLMKLLEKYIQNNRIKIIEPFVRERKSVSEKALEFLVGVIEIKGIRVVILLEVMNDLITSNTLCPYIVYLYNIQLDNMIIYLTNPYDETASALITSLKAEKKISLLQLGTMMAQIKRQNSYLEYLQTVIA